MILYFSDFDLNGSGYQRIGAPLCEGLQNRGHDVLVFGLGYKGQPHQWPFRLCPARFQQIPSIINGFGRSPDTKVDAIINAFDIPLQLAILSKVGDHHGIPWIGIYPLESIPLCESWAMRLMGLDSSLVISEFGTVEANRLGLDATHLKIGIDLTEWNPPTPPERKALRKSMEFDDKFVVLTVADNQERKNLARSMEIFADFAQTTDAVYLMVTREGSPVGWVLADLAENLNITEKFFIWERGMPQRELRDLFAISDAFLLASKAEGLGMPVIESMAMELPVVGTKCTAIEEHLKDGRGLLVEPDYVFVDPWGNSLRYMMSRSKGVEALHRIANADPTKLKLMVERARQHVETRIWSDCVDILEEAIRGAQENA